MSGLAGLRVLIVEDEALVAFALEDMLQQLGCAIVGPAMRLADALALVESEAVDAAVLDVNIAGDRSYSLAETLDGRGVPYLFATGYGHEGVELRGTGARVLAKPYRQHEIESELLRLMERRVAEH